MGFSGESVLCRREDADRGGTPVSRSTPPPAGRAVQPRATRLTKPLPPPSRESPLESILQQLHVRGRRPGTMVSASVGSALEAIWANRLRSLLTMLGIFIG